MNKARAYSQTFKDVCYYVTPNKLFVYYKNETTPRITFTRDGQWYKHDRVQLRNMKECVEWAVRQPEFAGVPIYGLQKTLTLF